MRRFCLKNAVVLLLFLISVSLTSCVSIFFMTPKEKSLNQRLASFPKTDLPLQEAATIYWDEHMIPFIEARSDRDCAFLLGTIHAHLRLAQMEIIRRAGQGRLSEGAGPFAVQIDEFLRILNLGAVTDSVEMILPKETREWLENYVAGINYYQDQLKDWPLEHKLLNIKKEPWHVRDILLIGRVMSADVNWFNWFQWLELQDKPYFDELWSRFVDIGRQSTPTFSPANGLTRFLSFGIKSGSNALVVSGNKSQDGNALIASDPHLGLQLPNTWIIAGFKCPSFHVLGLLFPGVPMVLIGRNEQIAWAGTNMRSASSDLYQIDLAADSIATKPEKIKVRWWRDKIVAIRTSSLGPILSDAKLVPAKPGQALALKWVGHSVSDEFSAFLRINRAVNWDEYRKAFRSYGVSGQNFLYADNAGQIGMVLAVRIPNRTPEAQAKIFLNSKNPAHYWNGVIGSMELPAIFNPQQEFLVSANNRPVPMEPPLGNFFSANDRVDRISALLQERDKIHLDDLKQLQKDVIVPSSVHVRNAMRDFLNHIPRKEKIEGNGRFDHEIQTWQGNYSDRSKGAVAFQMLLFHFVSDYYSGQYDDAVADLILSSEHANVLVAQDLASANRVEIQECMNTAYPKAVRDFIKFENWGKLHRLSLTHPLGNIPLIGGRFQYGDYPASGSYNSIQKTAHQITNKRHRTFYGANARFIARLGDINENYFVLLGGQDGWLGSDQLADMVPLWQQGEYLKIPFEIEEIKRTFPHQMLLIPLDQQ